MPTTLSDIVIDLTGDTIMMPGAIRKLKVDVNASLGNSLPSNTSVSSVGWYSNDSIVSVQTYAAEPYVLYIGINPVNLTIEDSLEVDYEVIDQTNTVISTGRVLIQNIYTTPIPALTLSLKIDSTGLVATFGDALSQTYHLQISTDAAFSNLIFDADSVSPTNFSPFITQYGVPYFARVRNDDAGAEQNWSNVVTFNVSVLPQQPTVTLSIITISENADQYELAFVVSGSNGVPINYEVQSNIGDSSSWTSLGGIQTVIGDGTYTIPLTITSSGGYAYRLQINGSWYTNEQGLIVNSLPLSTTVINSPGTLIPILSIDSINQIATFSNTGATGYHLQINNSLNFNTPPLVFDANVTSPTNFSASIQALGTYYAQVRNSDGNPSVSYGDIIPFNVTRLLAQPSVVLSSPGYNSNDGQYELPFMVSGSNGVAVNYQLFMNIGDSTGWTAQGSMMAVSGDGAYTLPLTVSNSGGYGYKLQINGSWYTNEQGLIVNSLPLSTTVINSPGILIPILSIDSINQIATFSNTGATGYHLQINNSLNFNTPPLVFDANVTSPTNFSASIQALGTYYAQVRNSDGNPSVSYGDIIPFNVTRLLAQPSVVLSSPGYNSNDGQYELPFMVSGSNGVAVNYQLFMNIGDSTGWTAQGSMMAVSGDGAYTLPLTVSNSGGYGYKLQINGSWYTNEQGLIVNSLPLSTTVINSPGTLIPILSIDSINQIATFSNTGATGYHLQINNSLNFNTPPLVFDANVTSPTNFSASIQALGTYYAQVRNSDGNPSVSYGDIIPFNVTRLLAQPSVVLSSPGYNSNDGQYELPFMVSGSNGVAVNYQLFMNIGDSTGWTAQGSMMAVSGDGAYTLPLTVSNSGGYGYKLQINGSWYTNEQGLIVNSLPLSTTVINSPGTLIPILSIDSINQIATFSNTGATGYHLQINNSLNFNTPPLVFDANVTSPTNFSASIQALGTYYAQVRNSDGNPSVSYGDIIPFNVTRLLAQPSVVLSSPGYNSNDGQYELPFTVSGSNGVAVNYQLFMNIGDSNGWVAQGGVQTLVGEGSYILPLIIINSGGYEYKLQINGSWYTNVQVLIVNSLPLSTTVINNPGTLIPILSIDSINQVAKFSNTGATGYHLQISTNASFSTPLIFDADTVSPTNFSVFVSPGVTYYAQIRNSNGNTNIAYGNVVPFYITALVVQPIVTLSVVSSGPTVTGTIPLQGDNLNIAAADLIIAANNLNGAANNLSGNSGLESNSLLGTGTEIESIIENNFVPANTPTALINQLSFTVTGSGGATINYQLWTNVGDSNGWTPQGGMLSVVGDGIYSIPLYITNSGGYVYKLLINGSWYTNLVSLIINTLPIQSVVLSSPGSLIPAVSIDNLNMVANISMTGAQTYHLQIATTPDFSGTLLFDNTTSSPADLSEVILPSPAPYFARVCNAVSGANISWSDIMTFYVTAMITKSVVITNMSVSTSGSTNQYGIQLNTIGSGGAISYQLWANASGTWQTVGSISTINGNGSTTLSGLTLPTGATQVQLQINETWFTNSFVIPVLEESTLQQLQS